MADLNELKARLVAANLNLSGIEVRNPRELRVSLPRESLTGFADYLRAEVHARPELIVAEDTRLEDRGFTLRYIFELEGAAGFVIASVSVPAQDPTFPSLATRWYLASRFEREIHDLFGLVPTGHPDLHRLPLHQYWPPDYHPLLKDATVRQDFYDDGETYPFRRVEGEGVYEITVGPVHAGIIEPGHFRFSVEGETIINLESRMYFVHKGIEKLFESATLDQGLKLAERISGDSSVAHALAFCQAVESLAGVTIPPRAAYLRSFSRTRTALQSCRGRRGYLHGYGLCGRQRARPALA
jgi:Ni,Fe-hydrogenase III component G